MKYEMTELLKKPKPSENHQLSTSKIGFFKILFLYVKLLKIWAQHVKDHRILDKNHIAKKFSSLILSDKSGNTFLHFPKKLYFRFHVLTFSEKRVPFSQKKAIFYAFFLFGSWHTPLLTNSLIRVTQSLVSAQSWRKRKRSGFWDVSENPDLQPEISLERSKLLAHRKELTLMH